VKYLRYLPHGSALLLAGVSAFLFWLRTHDAAVASRALLDSKTAATVQLKRSLDSATAHWAPIVAALKTEDSAQQSRANKAAARARRDQDAALAMQGTVDSLLAAMPDTPARITITNELTAERDAVASCSLALVASDSVGTLCHARLAAADSLLRLTRAVVDSQSLTITALHHATHPSIFGQIRSGLPWAVAGALVVLVVRP